MGEIEFCIGTQIKKNHQLCIVELNQSKYKNDVLKIYSMENCKPIFTPFESRLKLIKDQYPSSKKQRQKMVEIPYKSRVGNLMYAMVYTQLDIVYVV
jgi:hypothetical protein